MKIPFKSVTCAIFLTAVLAQAAELAGGQFRGVIEREKPKLGTLTPWQNEVFDQEVLASSGRFIKDYQTQGDTVSKAEVDIDAIKKYLAFHATQIVKPETSKMLLSVRVAEDCETCIAAAGNIREDLRRRFTRRGLIVLPLERDEARRDLVEMLSVKAASGWALVRLRQIEDPEHPGDFKIKLDLEVRFPGTILSLVQKQMELLTSESIEITTSRMMIELLSEAGQKIRLAQLGVLETSGSLGVDLKIQGCRSYSDLKQVKAKLQDRLRTDARVVEKKINAQDNVLAVISSLSIQEVSQAISQIKLDTGTIKVVSNEGKALRLIYEP